MINIFCLSRELKQEDRFTASLHYLIEVHPEIGQVIANYLLEASGWCVSKFIKSELYPSLDFANRPDFLIECQDIDIICEHKIASPLGEKQLERYLALQTEKNFVVALITAKNCDVSLEVKNHPRYLKPSHLSYFKWQDIYPIIANQQTRLAQDFAAYMIFLGMKPWQAPTLADLFDNNNSAEYFGQAWDGVRHYFKNMGAKCKISSSKLGFEISKPLPWLHLLYIYADHSSNISINEPCFLANIWVHKEQEKIRDKFYGLSTLEYKQGMIYIEQSDNLAKWNQELVLILRFYISLDSVLVNDIDIMRDRILNFTLAVFECCHTRIYHL